MAEIKVRGESKIILIPIYRISENISFPMRTYTKQQILPLAESIAHNGILQPLIVRKCSVYSYELISGKRRLQAAVMAGKRTVPCIVLHCSKSRSLLFSLAENFQRYNYTYIESLRIINVLIQSYDYTVEKIAELFGRREAEIKSLLKLNQFQSGELIKIEKHHVDLSAALLLTKIKDPHTRSLYLEKVISENIGKDELKQLIAGINKHDQNKKIVIKNMQIFHNSINKILETLKMSGVDSLENIYESDDFIRYVIKIPKN